MIPVPYWYVSPKVLIFCGDNKQSNKKELSNKLTTNKKKALHEHHAGL